MDDSQWDDANWEDFGDDANWEDCGDYRNCDGEQ